MKGCRSSWIGSHPPSAPLKYPIAVILLHFHTSPQLPMIFHFNPIRIEEYPPTQVCTAVSCGTSSKSINTIGNFHPTDL